ncbi:hypothetical protein [Cupriavidus pauculus]|uniref:hypothetical protein n=1 Tax=Cupriavidus pauculus TaxID=82633 RepID=UPI001EE1DEE0|nr:hypothetical protein [Cupriavidus pauculus]GJG96842.1 DUF3775 domain-containing protein [Cupriavidus pauculus]
MTPTLRKTIDELVKLDLQRHEISTGGSIDHSIFLPDPVERLLATLSQEDLIYVKALLHYGRGDLEHDTPFSKYLESATKTLNDGSVAYLAGKNLSVDLPAALAKLGL